MNPTVNHPLTEAMAADRAFSAAIKKFAPGRDRWTLTPAQLAFPKIAEAYAEERRADDANHFFMAQGWARR